MTEATAANPWLADNTAEDWDDKRYVFRIGVTEHGEPERLSRSVRKPRQRVDVFYKFCTEHWSWTCFPLRPVSGADALAYVRSKTESPIS